MQKSHKTITQLNPTTDYKDKYIYEIKRIYHKRTNYYQDKAASRIYRVTFMRSDNGTTTGYNIIAERLL